MRIAALWIAVYVFIVGHAAPALGQVDQQRSQEFFRDAQAICERDDGRLWGASICMPMVIGDARTQTFATSQPPPNVPRPRLIGILNGPIQWGDTTWAASPGTRWSTSRPALVAGCSSMSRSTSVQMRLGLLTATDAAEHLEMTLPPKCLRHRLFASRRSLEAAVGA